MRLKFHCAVFVFMGFFTGFPYFLGRPSMLHETPWAVGLLAAASFFMGGMIFQRILSERHRLKGKEPK